MKPEVLAGASPGFTTSQGRPGCDCHCKGTWPTHRPSNITDTVRALPPSRSVPNASEPLPGIGADNAGTARKGMRTGPAREPGLGVIGRCWYGDRECCNLISKGGRRRGGTL